MSNITVELKNRIMFLDIDGCITSPRVLSWYNWDIYTVNFLHWVCKEADVKIVISSTWRHSYDKDFFSSIFGYHLHEDWKTVDLRKKLSQKPKRGKEIKEWLSRHPEIDDYLILDDDNDMLCEQLSHFIQTDRMNGILSEHMVKIKEHFRIDSWRSESIPLFQCEQMFAEYNL